MLSFLHRNMSGCGRLCFSRLSTGVHMCLPARSLATQNGSKRAPTVSHMLLDYVHQEGTTTMFGIIGKAIAGVCDAQYDSPVKLMLSRHEGGAAMAAFGYAQASGKLGVCCATSGGGATNLTTGVACAWSSSVPLLAITGQVPTGDFGRNGFQESTGEGRTLSSVDMFRSMTKYSAQITSVAKAPEVIRKAIRMAVTGRPGPVHINMPLDMQTALVPNYKGPAPRSEYITDCESLCDTASLQKAADLINSAKKPLILFGWGATFGEASQEALQLAERFHIPIATTPQGKGGIPANHPYYIGQTGMCSHAPAFKYWLDESDLLIAVGTSFNEFATLSWDPRIAKKKLLHIDIDPSEIGKNFPAHASLVGDAKLVLQQLYTHMCDTKVPAKNFAPRATASQRWDMSLFTNAEMMTSEAVPLKPPRVMKELRDSTPDDTIFTADSGAHWAWMVHYVPLFGGKYLPGQALGTMGSGICGAIGAQAAFPNAPVVSVCGDGSFQMHGNEIGTAKQYNLPVVWVILNDRRYNMPCFGQRRIFGRGDEICALSPVDFVKYAQSIGLRSYRVTKPGELARIMPEVLASRQPTVIDVMIDQEEVPPVGPRLQPVKKPSA